MTTKELRELIELAEALQRKKDQAEGAFKETMRMLKEKYGCDSLKEAELLLEKKEKRIQQLQQKVEDKKGKLKEKWKDILDD